MTQLMIRPYQPDDADAIVDLWHAASRVAHPFLPNEFIEAERVRIRELYLPNAETWVCVSDGEVRAFIAMIGDEVGGLFAHPDYHKRGLGRALMDKVAATRKQLFLDVFKENSIGRAFYESYGFRYGHEHVHEESGHVLVRMEYDC